MIHATAASQDMNLQVNQSPIVGIGLTSGQEEAIASTAAVTGRLPARHLLYKQLEELTLGNEEWTGLFQIAVAMICYGTNRELQFQKAKSALISSSLGNFKKPSEALAHISKLLQDANTAFGKQFITYCDMFNVYPRQAKAVQRNPICGSAGLKSYFI